MINSRSRDTKTVRSFEGLYQSFSVIGKDRLVARVTHDHVTIISDGYGPRINQMLTDDFNEVAMFSKQEHHKRFKPSPWMTMTSSDVVNSTEQGNLILSALSPLSPIVLRYLHWWSNNWTLWFKLFAMAIFPVFLFTAMLYGSSNCSSSVPCNPNEWIALYWWSVAWTNTGRTGRTCF